MRERRGVERERELCSGPGKLTQALGIGLELNDTLALGDGPISCCRAAAADAAERLARRADRHHARRSELPWRFCDARSRSRLAALAAGDARLPRRRRTAGAGARRAGARWRVPVRRPRAAGAGCRPVSLPGAGVLLGRRRAGVGRRRAPGRCRCRRRCPAGCWFCWSLLLSPGWRPGSVRRRRAGRGVAGPVARRRSTGRRRAWRSSCRGARWSRMSSAAIMKSCQISAGIGAARDRSAVVLGLHRLQPVRVADPDRDRVAGR